MILSTSVRHTLAATVVIVSASIALYVATTFPLEQNEEPVVTSETDSQYITIASGESHTFELEIPELTITGFTFTAKNFSGNGNIRLEVKNTASEKLRTSYFFHTRTHETSSRIIFPLFYGTTHAHDMLSITLTRLSGEPLQLAVNDEQALVTAISVPRSLTDAERQGIVASIVVALALLLAHLTPSSKLRWVIVGLTLLGLPLITVNAFWLNPDWGIGDWDYRFGLHHIFRTTVLNFHEFPFWNPYTCGGAAGIGDPEFSMLSPTFLLELILGIPKGTKLAIYLGLTTLSFGVLQLATSLRLSWFASFTTALLATYSSAYILKIAEGHVTIIYAFMWIPWVLWAWRTAYQKLMSEHTAGGWPLLVGVLMTLMLFQGGMYMLFYLGFALLFLCCVSAHPKTAGRVTLQSFLWFLGLGSVKLIPNVYWLYQFPDTTFAPSAATLPHLSDIFLRRYVHGSRVLPNQVSGWHEYGAYIGFFGLFLVLLGSSLLFKRRLVRLIILGTTLTIVISSLGPVLTEGFAALPLIPRSNISRLSLFAVLGLALLAGFGSDVLRVHFKRFYWLPIICIMLLAADVLTLSSAIAAQTFVVQPHAPKLTPAPAPIAYTINTYAVKKQGREFDRTYAATMAGYGTFSFCAVLGPQPSVEKQEGAFTPPYLQLADTSQSAEVMRWSPNTITIKSALPHPTDVVINANYAPGWHAGTGATFARGGRLATILPAGETTTVLRYRPPLLRIGIVISFCTLLAALYFLRTQRHRH